MPIRAKHIPFMRSFTNVQKPFVLSSKSLGIYVAILKWTDIRTLSRMRGAGVALEVGLVPERSFVLAPGDSASIRLGVDILQVTLVSCKALGYSFRLATLPRAG
jgi:hypothetical protein